jgi:hypothetical protein
VPKLKHGSWYIGGIDAEAADSIDRLQFRLREMRAEGWEVQRFNITVGARSSRGIEDAGFLALRAEATLRMRGSGEKTVLTL